MLTLLKEPAISVFLATVSPTIALVAVNIELFSKKQMRNSVIAISIVGAVLAALFYVANAYLLLPLFSKLVGNPVVLSELTSCLISFGIFFVLSERLFSELIEEKKTRIYTKLALVVSFALITSFFSIAVLNIIFALYTVMSVLDVRKNIKRSSTEFSTSLERKEEESTESVEFKYRPNVYVLFLESFQSSDVLENIYRIDNKELCSHLRDKNFTIYDDVYSNSTMTELSFSNMIWPNMMYNPLHFRDYSQVPSSRIVSAFHDNGYQWNLFSSDYLKSRFSDLFHYSDSGASNVGSNLNRLFAPIFAQSALLRGLFSIADIFENNTNFVSLLADLQTKIEDNKDTPQLHWFHFGAQHSPQTPWNELEFFEKEYAGRYRKAEKDLEKTIDVIMEHDPNPLIISVGDHGACRYRYISNGVGDDPNEIIRSRGYEPALIAKDFCSVFLGIHWPVKHYTEGEVLSHVRLFDHVIAALSEDKNHLKNMMPNESFFSSGQLRTPVTMVRDGIPLKDWEPVSEEKELSHILDEIEKDPKDVQKHLALVQKYFKVGHQNTGMDYLLSMTKQFPDSEEARLTLSQNFMDRNDLGNVRKHALAAITINPKSGMAYYWLALAAEGEGQDTKCEKFITMAYECGGNLAIKKDLHLRYAYILMKGEKYDEAFEVINQVSIHDRIEFTESIDWQMQFISFLRGDNDQLFSWLDSSLIDMKARQKRVVVFERKLILCILTENWVDAELTARKILEFDNNHLGAHVVLGRSLEFQGKIPEALQTYAEGLATTKNRVLLEQLGLMAIRNNINHPDLVQIKAIAQEQCKARESSWGQLTSFDEKWYAKEYGHLLGGLSPLEHYMHNSVALMLNPNKDFDTAYYFSNHTDVFKNGVDASLHYSQYGQHELFRPRLTCILDHSITPNVNWRSATQ